MAPESILVVDDDPNILEVIRTRLGAAGYAVATAETADDALAKAAEEPFNLVVTDLKLAADDGLELMAKLLLRIPTCR